MFSEPLRRQLYSIVTDLSSSLVTGQFRLKGSVQQTSKEEIEEETLALPY